MSAIGGFIKRRPVLAHFILTFVISWGGILIVVGGPDNIPGTADQIERLMLFVMLALFAGPSLSGLVMTGIVYGRAGFRDLFSRMTRWRVGARWYAAAILAGPLLFLGVSLTLSLFSSEFLPGVVTATDKAGHVLFSISYGLIGGGLLEELGWTGFAVPALRRRYGAFTTALIVGVLWGAWHFLVILYMSDLSGEVPLALMLPIQLFSWLPAFRVLMVRIYDRTGGSLLLAMLMHGCLSSGMLLFQPLAFDGTALLVYVLALAAAAWAVVAATEYWSAKKRGAHRENQA